MTGPSRSARAPRPAAGSASSSGPRCRTCPSATSPTIAELLDLPEGQRLVILAGTEQRLTAPTGLRLGLEAIHPGRSGILDAYATAQHRPPRARGRQPVVGGHPEYRRKKPTTRP